VFGLQVFGPHTGILYSSHDLLDKLCTKSAPPVPTARSSRLAPRALSLTAEHLMMEYFLRVCVSNLVARQGPGQKHSERCLSQADTYQPELNTALLQVIEFGTRITSVALPTYKKMGNVPTSRVYASIDGTHHGRRAALHMATVNGNYYALEVMNRLGLEEHGGIAFWPDALQHTWRNEKLVSALRRIERITTRRGIQIDRVHPRCIAWAGFVNGSRSTGRADAINLVPTTGGEAFLLPQRLQAAAYFLFRRDAAHHR